MYHVSRVNTLKAKEGGGEFHVPWILHLCDFRNTGAVLQVDGPTELWCFPLYHKFRKQEVRREAKSSSK